MKWIVTWGVQEIPRSYKKLFSSYRSSNILCSQACGGPNRLSIYSSSPIIAFPVPTAHTTELPAQWQYRGCLRWASRILLNGVTEYSLILVKPSLERCSHT